MGKKQQRRTTRRDQPTTPAGLPPLSEGSVPRLKHRWLARLAAAVLLPALLLGAIELTLRIFGSGYPTHFFAPVGDGKTLTTNPKFAWPFHARKSTTSPTPLLFPKKKAPGTFRIFVLGESAAAGTPDPAFGFARQLDLMLHDQYPGRRFEVINAAMRGIDSHIVRSIAAECATLAPDLFILYLGNNEMVGLHAPVPGEFRLTSNIHWIRLQHAIHRTRLAQWGRAALQRFSKNSPVKAQDMAFFRRNRLAFDDPQREPVYAHYRRNLADICDLATAVQAQTLVCSVGVNLRDFPPLGSLHRRDLTDEQRRAWDQFLAVGVAAEARRDFAVALASYESAARLDDHHAELLFRMAGVYEALGQRAEAGLHYARARDWDAMQFRADGRINALARSVATHRGSQVQFLDMEKNFATSPLAENRIPGGRIFYEHVHLTFDGDYQLATTLRPLVVSALKLPVSDRPVLSREECARRLACTVIDEINLRAAIVRLTANPPFLDQINHATRQAAADAEVQQRLQQITLPDREQAVTTYREAVQARPDDWMLRYNFANLLVQLGQHGAATEEFEKVVNRLPAQRNFRLAYGNALLQSGQAPAAAVQFEAALRLDPDFTPAQQALAAARRR